MTVRLRDMAAGEWLDTELRIEPGAWTRLRIVAARALGTCYATVTPDGAEEQSSAVRAPTRVRHDLYLVELAATGDGAANVDDVALLERL